MLYISTTRISLHLKLTEDGHSSSVNMQEIVYFLILQFKYLSNVSAVCWNYMNSVCNARCMNHMTVLAPSGTVCPFGIPTFVTGEIPTLTLM